MLNHLILNRLTLSLLLAISFPAALIGCQSNIAKDNSTPANSIVTGSSTSAPISYQPIIKTEKLEEKIVVVADETANEVMTLQWASNYYWQLTQVKDKKSNAININTDAPITLEIAPSSLSLFQGCQHFAIKFVWMSAPPFEYGSELRERSSTCESATENKVSNTNIKKLFPNDNNIIKLDVELLPVAKIKLVNTQMASKNLVIKIENGNTLTFDGTPRTFKEPTGLPIDKALLEHYDWRLVSAVRNTFNDKGQVISRESIGHFYHPEFPVSLKFRGYDDSQYAFFSSSCNGIGGPYILMKDYTLLVGSGPQTLMGCGVTGNRIEGELAKLISNSQSTLSLSLQPSQSISPTADDQTDMSRYNLLQTMETGETLVWQNEVKTIP
ncbi:MULTISPECIES: hypothetical protein [unclassified Psychrobacter]|uniref:hypothetical protein n=1 Tax=unclassified Psychrobacter TaxID=196806 RepID=UPI000EDC5B8B|nr:MULTISPECIES: hypothetical protein [unclassified Psychrobacter]MBE8609543.1 hypothetical protein [Pseudomonas lundensis]HCI77149.1 hypothetical protein [Psychrobacter sp.]